MRPSWLLIAAIALPLSAAVCAASPAAKERFVPRTNPGLAHWLAGTFGLAPFRGFVVERPLPRQRKDAVAWTGPGISGGIVPVDRSPPAAAVAPIASFIATVRRVCAKARLSFALGSSMKFVVSTKDLPPKTYATVLDVRLRRARCGPRRIGAEWLAWEPAFPDSGSGPVAFLSSVQPPPGFLVEADAGRRTQLDAVLDLLNRAFVAFSTPSCRWRDLVPASCRFTRVRVRGGYGAIAIAYGADRGLASSRRMGSIVANAISPNDARWAAWEKCPGGIICGIDAQFGPGQCGAFAIGLVPNSGGIYNYSPATAPSDAAAQRLALSSCSNASATQPGASKMVPVHLHCTITVHACNAPAVGR